MRSKYPRIHTHATSTSVQILRITMILVLVQPAVSLLAPTTTTKLQKLVFRIRKRVPNRTQLVPFVIAYFGLRAFHLSCWIFRKDNSQTPAQVPINVTMENPWTWIIRFEPNRRQIRCRTTRRDNITLNRINVIVSVLTHTTNNTKAVPV